MLRNNISIDVIEKIVGLNSKEIERWYNLYYIAIYENGVLVGKEKEIEIF